MAPPFFTASLSNASAAEACGGGAPDQFARARDLERGAAYDSCERAEIGAARGLDRA
jgi:hypothetical protein